MKAVSILACAMVLVVAGSALADGGTLLIPPAVYPTSPLPPNLVKAPGGVVGMPASVINTDWVDIGVAPEGHNMQGWGPVEPATHGGAWGGEGNCRVLWDISDDNPVATIDLDFGAGPGDRWISFRWLDGMSDSDDFDIVVGAYAGHLQNGAPAGTENWVDLGACNVGHLQGIHTVTLTATGAKWSGFATYGQVALSEIAAWRDPEAVPAVSEWGLLLMVLVGLIGGTFLFGRRRVAA